MFIGQRIIDAAQIRVVVASTGSRGEVEIVDERIAFSGPVGQRPIRQNVRRYRVDAGVRNCIAGKRIPNELAGVGRIGTGGGGVVDDLVRAGIIQSLAEVAGSLQGGGNSPQ